MMESMQTRLAHMNNFFSFLAMLVFALSPMLSAASENDRRMLNALATADQDWMQAFAIHGLPAYDAEELLTELAARKHLSAHAAYLVSLACQNSQHQRLCNDNALQLKALDADPGNLAAYLLAMDSAKPEQQVWLLQQAAINATRSDFYWYRGAPAMLERINGSYIAPAVPEPEMVGMDESIVPALHLVGYQMGIHVPNLSVISQLCGFEPLLEASRRQNCLKIASLMQQKSNTLIDYSIGNAIERRALLVVNPDDTRARRLFLEKTAVHLAMMCSHAGMMAPIDPVVWKEMPAFLQAVHQFGEIEGNRVHGQAMYLKYPELYEKNPAECARYTQLPDAKLEALVREEEGDWMLDQFKNEQAQARELLKDSKPQNRSTTATSRG